MAIIKGTAGNDAGARTLNGTTTADQIFGFAGNDTIIGFSGDDVLSGGAGADEQFGSDGFDTASYAASAGGVRISLQLFQFSGGEAQGDTLFSIEGLIGSAHTDVLIADDVANRIDGGGGNDQLQGLGGNDNLLGGTGNDLVIGGDGADRLFGNDGNDRLLGSAEADQLFGGNGNDVLEGGAGADQMQGDAGIDTANYANAASSVAVDLAAGTGRSGEAEGDRLVAIENLDGSSFSDGLCGNAIANRLRGDDGNDNLDGMDGNDRLEGGSGIDFLIGGNGGDVLLGGEDRDLLWGQAGRDELHGGAGADTFFYASLSDSGLTATTRDVIVDFSHAQGDRIALSPRVLGDSFEFRGKAAFTGADQIRYVHDGGTTRVDINADADAAPEMQITLAGRIDLAAGDFDILTL